MGSGISETASSAGSSARAGASSSSASSGSVQHQTTPHILWRWSSSGNGGAGGMLWKLKNPPSDSGCSPMKSRYQARISLARSTRPEHRPADDRPHRNEPEHERGDDAEVPASATDCPEQILVLVLACPHERSRRRARGPPTAGCRSSARAPRVRWPVPPPSVSPPTPVVEMIPAGRARPNACVA